MKPPARPTIAVTRTVSRNSTVSARDRGLAVLRCFDGGQRPIGASELARLTGIPRPSVVRLAASLMAHNLLCLAPDGERYTLGAGVMSLANAFLGGLDVRATARVPMPPFAELNAG